MEERKRPKSEIIEDSPVNKKPKLEHQSIQTNKTNFENLANEMIYENFDYLYSHHIYKEFTNLNRRFTSLLKTTNILVHVNLSKMTKTDFERYYICFILPNHTRIKSFRLSNPFTMNLVFSPARLITQFVQLERLVLDHIDEKSFQKLANHLFFLPNLHSLIIAFAEYRTSKHSFSIYIFFNKINIFESSRSSIEYLVINTKFPMQSFHDLLSCLLRLRHLSINSLTTSPYLYERSIRVIELNHLKYLSLSLDAIDFHELEYLIKNDLHRLEILRLITAYDREYFDGKQWDKIICVSMPNLRIFDLNHYGYSLNNQITFHDLMKRFHSSFRTVFHYLPLNQSVPYGSAPKYFIVPSSMWSYSSC